MSLNTRRSGLAPAVSALLGATTAGVLLASIAAASGGTPPEEAADLGVITQVRTRAETLWIFDADFEDLVGDNAGWTTSDMSGRPPCPNYWHKDTIRINGFEHLGDSTWWCGRVDTADCWRQPRGYGNDWTCILEREFPLSEWSDPGDEVVIEWDQRYAMEMYYDYGYVDVSTETGACWTTIAYFNNRGFQPPGMPRDWDGPHAHQVHDLSDHWAGTDARLRFRFESDCAYSSEDQYDNPMQSVRDGAWQIDNIELSVNGGTVWLDDCEAPGDHGWIHDGFPGADQTGVTFRRVYEEFEDPVTRELHAGWMMAPYDSLPGRLVDGQRSWLLSPVIDISGAPQVVGEWSGWLDLRPDLHDRSWVCPHQMSDPECVGQGRFEWEWWAPEVTQWITMQRNWDVLEGHGWLELRVEVSNWTPAPDPNMHGLGFVLDRLRLGARVGTAVPGEGLVESRLEPARPTPFATSTVIACVTPQPCHVIIRVHDLSGRVVRSLVDGVIEAGTHELIWDGTTDSGARAASGVYFIRMETGGYRAAEKLVLLK